MSKWKDNTGVQPVGNDEYVQVIDSDGNEFPIKGGKCLWGVCFGIKMYRILD